MMSDEKKQITFFEAFAYNPATCNFDIWKGTAPISTIKKFDLKADLSYPLYGDESMCVDGWGSRAA